MKMVGTRVPKLLLALGITAAVPFGAAQARAFCRTTTQGINDPSFDPSSQGCWTQGVPLWWRSACISFDIQKDASTHVSYDQAQFVANLAFNKWANAACVGGSPSISARDLGKVDCNQVQYNQDQANQHVIVFRDGAWPYKNQGDTLGLTTVTFDKTTGEIYDADMEINGQNVWSYDIKDPSTNVPPSSYDFESIITHQAGHFFGLAHSPDHTATMFYSYDPQSTYKRTLHPDDVAGICSIYPADGTRATSTGPVVAGACDPTPRHGFSTSCAQTRGCNLASVGAGEAGGASEMVGFLFGAATATRRRGRSRAGSKR
jgi:hypothetical protein